MYAKLRQTVSSTQVPRNVLRGALLVALVLSLFFTAAPFGAGAIHVQASAHF